MENELLFLQAYNILVNVVILGLQTPGFFELISLFAICRYNVSVTDSYMYVSKDGAKFHIAYCTAAVAI